LSLGKFHVNRARCFRGSVCNLTTARAMRFAYSRSGEMHRQQVRRFLDLAQQPLPILTPPRKHLVGITPCARATLAADASASNASSTIRRFPATARRLRGSLLTTIRSEVSTYSQVDTFRCAYLDHHPRLPTLLTHGQRRTLTVLRLTMPNVF
jgi:hypothetical protein